ncbi:hypothetical protein FXF51_44810 [Nonomuraea sp. PA05]|uniref:hypothetical protein n=1 Tax=Nonomuraea sp. PA05 TaxID=2604466 RepID=UPI0011D75392|nr:hypothetical protein [Nonomuraea sp. PA05]TYB56226.1 hypothetical protein FXF51_44810 [Nonomuraea sp. PA05]
MSIELGWTVAVQAVTWTNQAVAAIKNRRQQRAAHTLANAGVLVAGVRTLDRRMHKLFLRLRYLDLEAWPLEARNEWIESVLALAHEDTVLPHMRAALHGLTSQLTELPQEIGSKMGRLTHIIQHGAIDPDDMAAEYGDSWTNEVLSMSFLPYADARIANVIPQIVSTLKEPTLSAEAIADLRDIASFVLGYGPQLSSESHYEFYAAGGTRYAQVPAFGGQPSGWALRLVADEAEFLLGQILAYYQRKYPAMPAPDWVWAQ